MKRARPAKRQRQHRGERSPRLRQQGRRQAAVGAEEEGVAGHRALVSSYDCWSDQQTILDTKLKQVAQEIRASARGRTCGGCFHFGVICDRPNLEWNVHISNPAAVACNFWTAKGTP